MESIEWTVETLDKWTWISDEYRAGYAIGSDRNCRDWNYVGILEFHFSYLYNAIEQRTCFVCCSKQRKANDVQFYGMFGEAIRRSSSSCATFTRIAAIYFIDWIIIIIQSINILA